ncbi:MAG: NYN domain-containing protein [Herminiimonas sp.]|nr:NYN domain-containing protein [Herminiimonas sp.]
MAGQTEITNMALFCDFENVALGVRDAKFDKFDIRRVLERLLLKGSIVVKKAYCDWDRYKEFKSTMHEAAFELIEIPHVRQSGKNSADIRMVVDALDLCYTKSHVDAFVIISGDSDFSPLVSKLRENNKYVIGIGVKSSTSDLLSANCDEFIFYDDLVREQKAKRKPVPRKSAPKPATAPATTPATAPATAPAATSKAQAAKAEARGDDRPEEKAEDKPEARADEERLEDKRQDGFDLIVETIEAQITERGEEKMWGSMVKQTMKRRRPGFTESAYGYRSFREMVEDAQKHNMLLIVRDEKPGQYTIRLPQVEE